jgi:uncharacterized lipoprotein YehR (DUF1307 family)
LKFPFLISVSLVLLISGCTNEKFKEEVERTEKVNLENRQKHDAAGESIDHETYSKLEKPLDEVIKENELDSVNTVEVIDISPDLTFGSASDFAQYSARILYKFYTSQITSEDYYTFLIQHGSETTVQELPSKEDALMILNNLQAMYKDVRGENYELTETDFNRLENEGHFYRKVVTTNGIEYFITTITKEENSWKFVQDEPSPPYVERNEE